MGNVDDVKGRVKEAAGDLTDDKDLKREGKVDRTAGAAKEKVDEVADTLKDAVGKKARLNRGLAPPARRLRDAAAGGRASWRPSGGRRGTRSRRCRPPGPPAIKPRVARLHVFQRTPPWVIPHPNRPLTRTERRLYAAVPRAQLAVRSGVYWSREALVPAFMRPSVMRHSIQRLAEWQLRRQVRDPALRARLRPPYRMGCTADPLLERVVSGPAAAERRARERGHRRGAQPLDRDGGRPGADGRRDRVRHRLPFRRHADRCAGRRQDGDRCARSGTAPRRATAARRSRASRTSSC